MMMMFAGDEKQDVERHRRPPRYRSLVVCGVHAPQALHQEPAGVRVPLRPWRHRPPAYHQPGGGVNQEEKRQIEQ